MRAELRRRATVAALGALALSGLTACQRPAPAAAPATLTPAPAPMAAADELPKARRAAAWAELTTTAHGMAAKLVHPVPSWALGYVAAENRADGFPEPRPVALSAAMRADLIGALESLPPVVQWQVGTLVAGVLPVTDLGSTAFAESILDAHGRAVGGFVVLDVAALDRPANDWATWRALSPFAATGPATPRLAATIAAPADNVRRTAIRTILLHEFGHLVAAVRGDVHPPWDRPVTATGTAALAGYPYAQLSWQGADDAADFVSRFDAAWPARRDVRYYAAPDRALGPARIPALYAAVAETDFLSLYGAQSPAEDFAEAYMSYVHVRLLRQPWQIDVTAANGQVVQRFGACWDEPRCDAKRAWFERFFAAP